MNNLLNSELRNNNLKIFDQSWEQTLMAINIALDMAIFTVCIFGNWKRRLSWTKCCDFKLFGSSSQIEPASFTKLKAMATDILEGQQQEALTFRKKHDEARARVTKA